MLADRVAATIARPEIDASRADPVTLEEFGALLGRNNGYTAKTRAGVSMSVNRALGLSAWYSGVLHVSTTIAGLPIHRYRNANGSREQRSDPSWMRQPDNELPWYALVEFWMMSLLHAGNAFTWKVRNQAGQVVGLREIHPEIVTTGLAPDGSKRFMVGDDDYLWTTRDILHIPGLTYNGRFGLNPIRYAADSLGSAVATDEYAARFFSNNTNLGGIISVQEAMTRDEAIALKEQWEAFHQGIINAHRTGVLSKGARYDRVTLNAEDTQLIQSRQYGVLEVARWLRLPPHKLYELTRSTNNNIEHQSIEAVQDCYQPWCERIEAHVNADRDLTVPGTYIEFTLEGRLRGDTASEYAALTQAGGRPWMTLNEIRARKNLPWVPGGDDVLNPLNMAAAGRDQSTQDTAGGPAA